MNVTILAISALLIGVVVGIGVGAFIVAPLFVKPSTNSSNGSSNCQPETLALTNPGPYNGYWGVNVQNAGPGTVTLAKYGLYANNTGSSYSAYPTDSYVYNSTTFNSPTANPVIASGVTLAVNAYMGSGWKGGYTIVTIITSCGTKWTVRIN